ncbi:MAG TPA: dihydrofolate reductase family protein [Chitinophagaceae bacterium]|jgi:dihydrofolate reductase|nr:dihydrofolate reductase family protein [Chitinophagaceae bacterium]
MRKIVLSMHVSLDGFVAGLKGEMDWIKLDDEVFDLVGGFTKEADTALYGRVTWEMMDGYWPTAADKPNASKHDIEHSQWYNRVDKLVLTKTMRGKKADKVKFISDNIFSEINSFKQAPGKNVMIFGSPTAAHSLMEYNLIDEYWLFVNPILLGQGIPLFANIKTRIDLKPLETQVFHCGVTALHYAVE